MIKLKILEPEKKQPSEGKILRVGFTGTRLGMNQLQAEVFRNFIIECGAVDEFHHGDCIGADADAHEIINNLKIPIILHPPIDPKFRAYCKRAFDTRVKKEYLARNRDIVDETNILVAVPEGFNELVRSGTWYTVRYAKKQLIGTYIIYMDGSVKET